MHASADFCLKHKLFKPMRIQAQIFLLFVGAQKNAPCSVARGRLCIAVPPRFAAPLRETASTGTLPRILTRKFGYPALDNGRKPGETLLRYHPANRMSVQAAAGCAYSRVSPAALHHPAVLFRVRCGAILDAPARYFFAVIACMIIDLLCSIK